MTMTKSTRCTTAQARDYAEAQHEAINQLYDGKPYMEHLSHVVRKVVEHKKLLPYADLMQLAICGGWNHDVIEDCPVTFNDVAKVLGEEVAELSYVLATPKGRNRAERHCDAYYQEIAKNKVATFVKICDRLANVEYSKANNSAGMLERYRQEQEHFAKFLKPAYPEFAPLWDQLDKLFEVEEEDQRTEQQKDFDAKQLEYERRDLDRDQ